MKIRAGSSNALAWVRVATTMCSSTSGASWRLPRHRSCHAWRDATWTTSPAPTATRPWSVSTTSRPSCVDAGGAAAQHGSPVGQVDLHDLARPSRTRRAYCPAHAVGSPPVVRARASSRSTAASRWRGPRARRRQRERRRGRHRKLLARGGHVDPDADHGSGSRSALDALQQDPADLRLRRARRWATSGRRRPGRAPDHSASVANPTSRGSHGQLPGREVGPSRTENVSPARGGVSQVRSSRPRPAVWCSATTHEPACSPARARSVTTALVEAVSSRTSTRHCAVSRQQRRGRGVGAWHRRRSQALD